MDKTTNKVSEPIPEASEEVKNPVSEPVLDSFVKDAGLLDVADQTSAGISEQLSLHQEKTKPAKTPGKSDPTPNPDDINTHPIKWYETTILGKLKRDENGQPKKKNGRPAKAKKGDRLVGGGTWPPATASTVKTESTTSDQVNSEQSKRMDLGKDAGEVLTGHMERIGKVIGGENAKPTPEEKKVISESLSASLGEWQVWPPLALLVFFGLYIGRVYAESKFTKDKEPKKNVSQTHSIPGNNGQRQNSDGKKTVYNYVDG